MLKWLLLKTTERNLGQKWWTNRYWDGKEKTWKNLKILKNLKNVWKHGRTFEIVTFALNPRSVTLKLKLRKFSLVCLILPHSCILNENHLYWNVLKCIEMYWNVLKCITRNVLHWNPAWKMHDYTWFLFGSHQSVSYVISQCRSNIMCRLLVYCTFAVLYLFSEAFFIKKVSAQSSALCNNFANVFG